MSIYQKDLRREIKHYKNLIRINNENIRITKYELFAHNHLDSIGSSEIIQRYSVESNQRRLIHLTLHKIRLKEILDKIIRLVH